MKRNAAGVKLPLAPGARRGRPPGAVGFALGGGRQGPSTELGDGERGRRGRWGRSRAPGAAGDSGRGRAALGSERDAGRNLEGSFPWAGQIGGGETEQGLRALLL